MFKPKEIERMLEVILTEQEIADRSREMSKLVINRRRLKAEAKTKAEGYAAEIKLLDQQIESEASIIEDGKEFRKVKCVEALANNRTEVEIIRADTWDVIATRPLTDEERQGELFAASTEKPAPTTEAAAPAISDEPIGTRLLDPDFCTCGHRKHRHEENTGACEAIDCEPQCQKFNSETEADAPAISEEPLCECNHTKAHHENGRCSAKMCFPLCEEYKPKPDRWEELLDEAEAELAAENAARPEWESRELTLADYEAYAKTTGVKNPRKEAQRWFNSGQLVADVRHHLKTQAEQASLFESKPKPEVIAKQCDHQECSLEQYNNGLIAWCEAGHVFQLENKPKRRRGKIKPHEEDSYQAGL